MSEQSTKKEEPLEVQVSKHLDMPADIIFSVLTKVPMLWWRLPTFGDFSEIHANITEDRDVVFEAKLGGRLYERWNLEDGEGTLFATVVGLRRPEVLVLEGSFGMGTIGFPVGSVTVTLTPSGNGTEVSITHKSLQCPSEEMKTQALVLWTDFLYRLEFFVTAAIAPVSVSTVNSVAEDSDDPEFLLETFYQDLQNNLIQVRQAVAQAIATEKQLEQQLQKNKDQAATWHNRATMAKQQGNEDLERQALQRKHQFTDAADDLSKHLASQRDSTSMLRDQLTVLEGEVQKAYTKKQILIARDKAEQATRRAREVLSRVNSDSALMAIELLEQKILERESKLAEDVEKKD